MLRAQLVRRHAMTFFERQPEMPQPFPKAPGANLRVMLGYKPSLHLGTRRSLLSHAREGRRHVRRASVLLRSPRARSFNENMSGNGARLQCRQCADSSGDG